MDRRSPNVVSVGDMFSGGDRIVAVWPDEVLVSTEQGLTYTMTYTAASASLNRTS